MSILEKYDANVRQAITTFWNTRDTQVQKQIEKNVVDKGMRAAVTGGKQLDGFIQLMRKIAIDLGIPKESIYTKANIVPGYFRPTKEWDFFIVSPKKHLIACIEFKSQVGSVGKNFNNRVEEALGSAVDLWTAFNEGAFPNQEAPWAGYVLVMEKNDFCSRPVAVVQYHFRVFQEFINTSYIDRYRILCKKLVIKRHYNSASLIWTTKTNGNIDYGYSDNEINFHNFVESFAGFLMGKMSEFR